MDVFLAHDLELGEDICEDCREENKRPPEMHVGPIAKLELPEIVTDADIPF